MTDQKLKILVDAAVVLDREINKKTELLKNFKAQLTTEAASRPDEHTSTDGGGSSWSVAGTDGCIAHINFPAPTLKSKMDVNSKTFGKIKAAAGRFFDRLFRPIVSYKPVENFREETSLLLGKEGPQLVKLCSTETSPRVSFETKSDV